MDIILSILVLSLAIVFMAAGILFGNKPLSGSCGGLNSNGICSYCGTEPKNCENL
ncbi:MAG: ApbE family protein [Candidatus Marinimicrobia bacterium]|nr:ApbE family protein [Candidatus Neomarinimicrobiota bacterium]|tara:strand:+ start:1928 stop:2092 length:165 start_codon:yes stop_codon:yes gene_type:complete